MNKAIVTQPARLRGSSPVTHGLLQRKCGCGNHTVAGGECTECAKKKRLLQRRLAIGSGSDPLEREADRIADQVVNAPAHSPVGGAPLQIQRYAGQHASENAETAPASVESVLAREGDPLESGLRQDMERRFGHDFSRVRIHSGRDARQSARDISASAYTVGHNIVFDAGRFAPGTIDGRRLLAHELTHVVQQSMADRIVNQSESHPSRSSISPSVQKSGSSGGSVSAPVHASANILQRQVQEPQRRGGDPQLATIKLPPRGEDQVRLHIFRYLCSCQGQNVSRTRLRGEFNPPGVVFQFCRGAVSGEIRGRLRPSTLTTGTATVTAGVNVAQGTGRPGVRVEVEGEARNTGNEPEVGGRARARVDIGGTGGTSIVGEGEVFGGLESGNVQSRIGGGVQLPGGVTITGNVTNPGQSGMGGSVVFGGPLGGPTVSNETCRECTCPTAYECLEDIPPRSDPEEVPYEVRESELHRYYFRLNSDQETRNPELRTQSQRLVSDLLQRLSEGWSIAAINGYASPEAEESRVNQTLSESRAKRLHVILESRLPAGTPLSPPTGRGELLGARASILPNAKLGDVIVNSGFRSPEDATHMLVGEEILTDQLADQFLDLFNRLPEPADRLGLFGVDSSSPLASQLLQAIDQFIVRRGRGHRPWERIFEYLRFANVELTHVRTEMRTETRTTQGSIRKVGELPCRSFSRQAEDEGRFGPAERPPSAADCPTGTPRNPERFADLCDYD